MASQKLEYYVEEDGSIVWLREKGNRVALETVRGLFSDAVKLWQQLKNEAIPTLSAAMMVTIRLAGRSSGL